MAKWKKLPKRAYCDGKKKMVSIRFPEALLKELERVAGEVGWTLTDVVTSALDQYVQWEKNREILTRQGE